MDLAELTDEVRKRAGQNVKLGYKVKFILGDDEGIIFWDGTEHPPAIDNEDKADATTTIRMSAENLEKLIAAWRLCAYARRNPAPADIEHLAQGYQSAFA